ncbi:26S proteasome regulatory subunit [Massospora cicadina]|nr:26S proteasome regulatory subunit [Massospora cicadina]
METENPVPQRLLAMKEQIREDLKPYFDDFLDLYERKLWHQLTLKARKICKINPLKYVSIALVVAHQCESSEKSIEFLKATAEKVDTPASREAHILASMEIASHILLNGSTEGVKAIVEKCQGALDHYRALKPLKEISQIFNRGEIGKFDSLVPHFSKQPLLETHLDSLKKKLILMALVEYIFNQKTDSRVLSFQNIALECRINVDEVEHVIMRALSLGLIKGSIDQVTQTVSVSWVQPRYLDKIQLSTLHGKLIDWSCKADKIFDFIQTLNPEITNLQ